MPTTIKSSNITDDAVTAPAIATDAVDSPEIAAGAVAASEIASTFDISSKTVTLPAAAVTSHVTAGNFKLDDLGAPDDNTDLDFSTTRHGLVPKGTDTGNFLKDNGTWTAVVGIPSGVIAMWSGAISNIPTGWVICDGTNSTPNLTDRFVIHADADSGGTRNVDATGGSHTSGAHTLSSSEMPSHTHTYTNRQGTTVVSIVHNAVATVTTGTDTTGNTSGATGSGGSHTHTATPKYYALAYIMKT